MSISIFIINRVKDNKNIYYFFRGINVLYDNKMN